MAQQVPLNGFEESVLSYLREKHTNLDLTHFDVVTYVEFCLDHQESSCPLLYGAACTGFEPGTEDLGEDEEETVYCGEKVCTNCRHYHEMVTTCGKFKFDLADFHEDIKTMLDIT